MLLDLCKEFKIVIFVAVFHGVHSDYIILWIFTEEEYGPGGGVVEAAGVNVRHLGEGEPGPLPGRGVISTIVYRYHSSLLPNTSIP
jgi:hypothetical protein